MNERDFEILDRLAARRGRLLGGPMRWVKGYLTGLILLALLALGGLAYVSVKHPPPPGTTTVEHLKFALAVTIRQLGFQTQAFGLFLALAEAGHGEAQSVVGYLYDRGSGVGQDPAEAAKWYRKAADQGYPAALNNLAALYLDGRGVAQDAAQAAVLYREAAREGDPVAETNLGQLYLAGRGVPQSPVEAIAWFHQAAKQGHAPAMYFLGEMTLNGWGLPEDRDLARSWFAKAAAAGSQEAEQALHRLDEEPPG